jgi:hypothetical protein
MVDKLNSWKSSQRVTPVLTANYLVFGLQLRSNLPLPGIVTSTLSGDSPAVRLRLGMRPYPEGESSAASEELIYTSGNAQEPADSGLRIWNVPQKHLLHLAYPDGTQFWLNDGRNTVWAIWPDTSSLEETCTYLLGPILGLLLRLRGITCLHASAINLKGQCVAFLGPAGAGKSTTAAAFARQGYPVISDDIVPLVEQRGVFLIKAANLYLCLWPDSVTVLYGSPDALPRFIPSWEKRRLDLGKAGTRFETNTLPLAAIYVLGERRSISAPCAESIHPRPALLSLVAETYASKALDRTMRAREFEVLGRLIAAIPVRRLVAHSDPHRINDVCGVVLEDLARMKDSVTFP